MRKLDRILNEAIPQKEILRQARARKVMNAWPEIVGEQLAQRSWPDRFERGTAYVAVSGSAWAQELRMLKDRILKKMNDKANEPALFSDLRFGCRPLPPESQTPRPQAPRSASPESPEGIASPPAEPQTPADIARKWFGKKDEEGT